MSPMKTWCVQIAEVLSRYGNHCVLAVFRLDSKHGKTVMQHDNQLQLNFKK